MPKLPKTYWSKHKLSTWLWFLILDLLLKGQSRPNYLMSLSLGFLICETGITEVLAAWGCVRVKWNSASRAPGRMPGTLWHPVTGATSNSSCAGSYHSMLQTTHATSAQVVCNLQRRGVGVREVEDPDPELVGSARPTVLCPEWIKVVLFCTLTQFLSGKTAALLTSLT